MRPVRGPHKKSVTSSHNINLVLFLNDPEKRSQEALDPAGWGNRPWGGRRRSPSILYLTIGCRIRQTHPPRTEHDLHQESGGGESPSCSQQTHLWLQRKREQGEWYNWPVGHPLHPRRWLYPHQFQRVQNPRTNRRCAQKHVQLLQSSSRTWGARIREERGRYL